MCSGYMISSGNVLLDVAVGTSQVARLDDPEPLQDTVHVRVDRKSRQAQRE